MTNIILMVISVVGFAIATWQAVLLSRHAPHREIALWLGASVILAVAGMQRIIFSVRSTLDNSLELPLGYEIMLVANPIAVAVVLSIVRPILETYRTAECKLQAREEAFQRSLATSRDPFAIIDEAGRYIYVNDAGVELFRCSLDQILGRHFREFIIDVDPASRGTAAGAAQLEREVLRADGSRITMECDFIALGDGRILIAGRDSTHRREAEAMRIRAERLGTVRKLGASVTSDFMDTLTFVKSSLDLTAEFGSARVPVDAPIMAVSHALELMQDFAEEAVDREDELQCPAIDIRPVVREAALLAADRLDSRALLEFFDLPTSVMVHACADDIARICAGLLANANAAIDESLSAIPSEQRFVGRVVLQLRQAKVHDLVPPADIEIVVDDNGGALDPEIRAHMFDPPSRDLSRRIRLGATHVLVLRLGGSMTVQRRRGGGGTATVRLPVAG